MYLRKLSLVNFKNFDSRTFDFEKKINCFVGQNGIGKTNILDAIYYLSFTKSYFNPVAVQNIQHTKSFFMVEGLREVIVVSTATARDSPHRGRGRGRRSSPPAAAPA